MKFSSLFLVFVFLVSSFVIEAVPAFGQQFAPNDLPTGKTASGHWMPNQQPVDPQSNSKIQSFEKLPYDSPVRATPTGTISAGLVPAAATPPGAIFIGTMPIQNKSVPILQHPHRVNVPDDLAFVEVVELFEKDGTSRVQRVFPCTEYQAAHYEGWMSCLRSVASVGQFGFQSTGNLFRDIDSLQYGVMSTNLPYLNRGKKAGFVACRETIKNLVIQGASLERIRELCQEANPRLESNQPRKSASPSASPIPQQGWKPKSGNQKS